MGLVKSVISTRTMLTVEIGFKSYFNRLSLCLLLGGCLLFLFREHRRNFKFAYDIIVDFYLLRSNAARFLPVMNYNFVYKLPDYISSQFF